MSSLYWASHPRADIEEQVKSMRDERERQDSVVFPDEIFVFVTDLLYFYREFLESTISRGRRIYPYR